MSKPSPFPTALRPMLASPGEAFDSPHHLFEVKWDGIRAIAYKDNDRFWIETRNLKAALPRFPELQTLHDALQAQQAIIDGEIVVFGADGKPDFDRVRSRNAQRNPEVIARTQQNWPAVFIAFDCLFHDGNNIMTRPLRERKEHLRSIVSPGPRITVPQGIEANGIAFHKATREQGLEGVVAKNLDSFYTPGKRSSDWVKIRNVRTADCVIGGYVPKGSAFFKSLLLGLYGEDNRLHYMGNVGTGFRIDEIRTLRAFFDHHLAAPDSPFRSDSLTQEPPIRWLRPTLVGEIEFLTLTGHGHFRHATFRGLRPDKNPGDCTIINELPPRLSRRICEGSRMEWQPK